MIRRPLISTLFPYTTLFRSSGLISFSYEPLRLSFSDLHQIFCQHFPFCGFGGLVCNVECGGLTVLDCGCGWHFSLLLFDDCVTCLRAYNLRCVASVSNLQRSCCQKELLR